MIAYADEVNDLLDKSVLLIVRGGIYSFGPASAESFFERYSWLDGNSELFDLLIAWRPGWRIQQLGGENRRLSDLLYNANFHFRVLG